MNEGIGVFIVVLLVWLVIMLICREIYCWYCKINRTVALLESIDRKLDRLSPTGLHSGGSRP